MTIYLTQLFSQPDFHQGLIGHVQLICLLPNTFEQTISEPQGNTGGRWFEVFELGNHYLFKIAANYVHFKPEIGESSNTWTVGAQMKPLPNTNVGLNYARNDSTGHPSIINLSAMYSLSKTTNLYAAFNRGTDAAPSSYSGWVDGSANATLAQSGSSNALILGLQKGF